MTSSKSSLVSVISRSLVADRILFRQLGILL